MRSAMIALAAVLGLACAPGGASAKDFKITSNQVKKACGAGLQGGGNAFGCTKCNGGLCRDYSCNGSGKGRQGCWEHVIKRTAPQNDKGHGRAARAAKADVSATAGGQGSKWSGKSVQGTVATPPKQGDPAPFNRHGGGRSSNNRR